MSDFSDNNRFAPPKAEVADPATPVGPPLAGRGARLGAVMLDGVIGSIVVIGMMFVTGHNYFTSMSEVSRSGDATAVYGAMFGSFAPGWLIMIAIQGWFLHAYGATVAKKLLGLRIVRKDGSRAGFVRLFFVRAGSTVVVNFIPLLGGLIGLVDALLIFRDSRQCLHDQIADTIVIRLTP